MANIGNQNAKKKGVAKRIWIRAPDQETLELIELLDVHERSFALMRSAQGKLNWNKLSGELHKEVDFFMTLWGVTRDGVYAKAKTILENGEEFLQNHYDSKYKPVDLWDWRRKYIEEYGEDLK